MRILIVADNASSKFGGEAFLPFNYFRLLRSRNIDVRLIVHERNKSVLVAQFPEDVDRLYFVKDTLLHKFAFRVGTLFPRRLAEVTTGFVIQITTQFAQRRLIRQLLNFHHFDVIHVPIPVSPKSPSLIYGFGPPVIFGPMNGGMEYPPAFYREESKISRFASVLGRNLASLLNCLFPGKRYARLLLVANARTRHALPRGIKSVVIDLVENGVDFSVWRRTGMRKPQRQLRLIFVGTLENRKSIEIVLHALHQLQGDPHPPLRPPVSFEIVGDGPMRESWERLSRELGLEEVVTFSGWMSQQGCARRLNDADIFVLSSLLECGGSVILEAMAMGLPVIATAWGGPLDYLDDSCGVLVRPNSRDELIAGFASAIRMLADSPELRRRLGEAGYQKARAHFDWEKKIDRILELYKLATQPAQGS